MILAAGLVAAPLALAQEDAPASEPQRNPEVGLVLLVNGLDGPVISGIGHAVDRSAVPLFAISAPALAMGNVSAHGGFGSLAPALRLGVSQALSVVVVYGTKRVVARPRPFAAHPDIVPRSPRYGVERASGSFPSTHAALAATTSTVLALNYPDWRVVAPVAAYGMLISASRLWLGVHYPSDIVVGWLVGAGVGLAVDVVHRALTSERSHTASEGAVFVVPVLLVGL